MTLDRINLITIILISFLLAFGTLAVSAQPQMNSAPQWEEVEFVFKAEQDYENPYTDVKMVVEFSGPNGRVIRRPAFWDGDNTWRVRFASPTASGGNGLCNLSTNYGKWPSNMDDFEDYVTSDSDSFSDDNWYFYLEGNGARVCCNANMSGCEKLASGSPCNANNPS
jgi:hypothetical protein